MSLIKTWAPFFNSDARKTGRAFQLAGKVTQIEPEDGEYARAQVAQDEGEPIDVVLYDEDGTRKPYCNSESFKSGEYCEYLWALIVELHQKGLTFPAKNNGLNTTEEEQIEEEAVGSSTVIAPAIPKARKRAGARVVQKKRSASWEDRLTLLRSTSMQLEQESDQEDFVKLLTSQSEIYYVIEAGLSARHRGLVVQLHQRHLTKRGWGKLQAFKLSAATVKQLPIEVDREICALLMGASIVDDERVDDRFRRYRASGLCRVPEGAQRMMLQQMLSTGRCFIQSDSLHDDSYPLETLGEPLVYSNDQHWVLWLQAKEAEKGINLEVQLRYKNQRLAVSQPEMVLGGPEGFVVYDGIVASLRDNDAFNWIAEFREDFTPERQHGTIHVPEQEIRRFVDRLYMMAHLPELDLPDRICRDEQLINPVPHLDVSYQAVSESSADPIVRADLWFNYDGNRIEPSSKSRFVIINKKVTALLDSNEDGDAIAGEGEAASDGTNVEAETQEQEGVDKTQRDESEILIRRDFQKEREAFHHMAELGFQLDDSSSERSLLIQASRIPGIVDDLLGRGWIVHADHHVIHKPQSPSLSISSGIDWFELKGDVAYETSTGTQRIGLPAILKAIRSGQRMVKLDDGSQGLLPESWLEDHRLLMTIGELQDDHIRFKNNQAMLLDTLLSQKSLVNVDARFEAVRQQLHAFEGVKAIKSSEAFKGELREYQQEGLGWMQFLNSFNLGGILADDMGLGKTVQVLAMLDHYYKSDEAKEEAHYPSIVVAPKSVVYNWVDEASRFVPHMRIMNYSGPDRAGLLERFPETDIIVTSYGLLRRDIEKLSKVHFAYAILDEAQAVKNPSSQSAKASRIVNARHRLALTGTPVENHLGDLWSIFEFANPGILGSGAKFAELVREGRQRPNQIQAAQKTGRALKPFILRRTKGQVSKDLPDKTEQTIICEMDAEQRKIYDDLRMHYRNTLLKNKSGGKGSALVSGNAMVVLEALLRLRQAACHPALIDSGQHDVSSAKLEVLMEQLAEIIQEGHKVLVFSQFTSMLGLVRQRLEDEGIVYEYLDGKTRHRKDRVERFQNDPNCPVFLISLKAGGLGLNLTAAEYVFILDPWWNPAVEAQAIDRAHRIGQKHQVFAYRLICQDTVEQRIAELQEKKKQIADAIVGGQHNLLQQLTRDDLDALLS